MSGVTDTTPTPEASVVEQDSSSPETPAGSEGGTQTADGVDAFAVERERLQSQIRTLQSDRDKAVVRAERAEAASAPAPSGGSAAQELGATLTAAEVAEIVQRSTQLTQAAERMRGSEEFKHADPAIFDRAHEFDSPEAFRVAVADNHAERAAIFQAGFQAGQGAMESGSGSPTPAPGPAAAGSTAPSPGLPSKQELAAFSQAEYERFVEKHGAGVVEDILRS